MRLDLLYHWPRPIPQGPVPCGKRPLFAYLPAKPYPLGASPLGTSIVRPELSLGDLCVGD
jgi:hypothetical protein